MIKQRLMLFVPLIIFSLLAILFWRGLSLDPNSMPSALLDKPVPKFSLPRLEDVQQTRDESMFKGRVTLLNVWATWCDTCHIEHAFLNELKQQGVHIIGVDHKDNTIDAQRWIAQLGNPYADIILDEDGRFGLDLGVFGLPETYVVDKQGIIRYKHIGNVNQEVWNSTLSPLIKQLEM
ncbi:MAG: DsbE family thiol:disulfide interchange protein [Pseudomonadota bacterium]